jgi:uncharacterized protein (TIRG00374 family)
VAKKSIKIVIPLLLGGFILYWVYRDFDFSHVQEVLLHATNWAWMFYSLLFGILSHLLRGYRWHQTLSPLGEHPRISNCIDGIFVMYAANLVVPRSGEVFRCAMLDHYDRVPFAKALGTVITERVVDVICMVGIALMAFLVQTRVFFTFFEQTGTKIPSLVNLITSPWFYVALGCVAGILWLAVHLVRTLSYFERVKQTAFSIWRGIGTLKELKSPWRYALYTLLIWVCYYFHFYFTFYCFSFTAHLGMMAGLVMFVAGTVAVLVPTPNGAGPWHFAIITMMMLYGVSATDAGIYALIVHAVQTLLVILLGLYGWLHVMRVNRAS